MHFLSHYYTELPENNPLFVAGLAIPDLAPGFSKTYNTCIKNSVIPFEGTLNEINQGVLSHYKGDKKFHNSEAFMQHLTLLLQSFIKEGLDRQRLRLSVIAHVAVEMMIDRQLVLQQPQLCVDYYKRIEQADEQVLGSYFKAVDKPEQMQLFLTKFRFFKQRKFLFLFTELENIVLGLSRVYSMTVNVDFTAEEKRKFLSALSNIDLVMRYSWQEILKA